MYNFWNYNEPSQITHPAEMKIMRQYLRKYASEDIIIPTVHAHKHELTLDEMNMYYSTFLQDLIDHEIDVIWISRDDKRYKHPHRNGVYVNRYTEDKWYIYNKK
jgi:hypothetical protein